MNIKGITKCLSDGLVLLFMLLSLGCGVKGRPLPPLNPAPLGHGEPLAKDPQKPTTPKAGK